MSEQSEFFKKRTMSFSIAVLRLVDRLPRTTSGYVVARQLARSATSVGANYRASCIARSRAEFIAKLGIVLEEVDESVYWLDLIATAGLHAARDIQPLLAEACELRAVFGKALGTARLNSRANNQIHTSARIAMCGKLRYCSA